MKVRHPDRGPLRGATAIFKDLLALPPDVRACGATLRCGDDVALRVEVEALLAVDGALSDLPSSDQSGVSPFTMPLPTGSPSREGRAGPLAPGSRLGPYQIVLTLGKGGMGVVYRARNDLSEKVVAIKVISPELLDNPEHRQCFLREIRIAIQIDDPRFVKTITAEDYSGTLFLVMEYIQGEDLERLGSRHPLLPPEEAVRLIITAAEALQYLHDTGVVHRDVKPSNLMVTRDGSLKLLDLGIAKLLDLKTGQVALDGSPRPHRDLELHGPRASRLIQRRRTSRRVQPGSHALVSVDREKLPRRRACATWLRSSASSQARALERLDCRRHPREQWPGFPAV